MLHLCTDVVVSDPGGPWLAHLPCKMESDQLKNETDDMRNLATMDLVLASKSGGAAGGVFVQCVCLGVRECVCRGCADERGREKGKGYIR
jgi:hypothetical protein